MVTFILKRVALFFVVAVMFGCSIEDQKRPETPWTIPSTELSLVAGLRNKSESIGPKLCEESGCPSLGQVLYPLFAASNSTLTAPKIEEIGLLAVLDALNMRTESLKARSKNQVVPCLEKPPLELTLDVLNGDAIQVAASCYVHFSSVAGVKSYEQLVFGSPSLDNSFGMLQRVGSMAGDISLRILQSTGEKSYLWVANNQSLSNKGAALSRYLLAASNTLEVAAAAYSGRQIPTPWACGIQLRADAEHIYVRGKLKHFSNVPLGINCNDIPELTYCLGAVDLSAQDSSLCMAKGLNSFELTPVDPNPLSSDAWGLGLAVDFSNQLYRFALEGLQKI